ncbi:hypothetical protein, partial [Cognatiyoonia sp. IB215182]|uniref:hypothetical protein n=1 Tax=Cognatiyoonia sp. IB215182 TaxID=3097353 RepID=UPI002A0DE859
CTQGDIPALQTQVTFLNGVYNAMLLSVVSVYLNDGTELLGLAACATVCRLLCLLLQKGSILRQSVALP